MRFFCVNRGYVMRYDNLDRNIECMVFYKTADGVFTILSADKTGCVSRFKADFKMFDDPGDCFVILAKIGKMDF